MRILKPWDSRIVNEQKPNVWAHLLSNDVDSSAHDLFLALSPWFEDGQKITRLERLNTDHMEIWVPTWKIFGKDQPKELLDCWEKTHPWLRLWLHFNDTDYEYTYYVDRLVHAAAHQDIPKMQAALNARSDTRSLTSNLPAWAAISAFTALYQNPAQADNFPDVVNALVDYIRMIANPGTSLEHKRFLRFVDIASVNEKLLPVLTYAVASENMMSPYNLDSEIFLAESFPLSIYLSAINERETTEEQRKALISQWPENVKTQFELLGSLGECSESAAAYAWNTHRACSKTKSPEVAADNLLFLP